MGRTACTEPQCLYKGALYLYLTLIYCISYVTVVTRTRLNINVETYVACLANFCTKGRQIVVFLTRISIFAGIKAVMANCLDGWVG